MKTKVTGRFVIGYVDGDHAIYPNGEVVYEGESIIFVGHGYPGAVDGEIEAGAAIVSPGFIDSRRRCHRRRGRNRVDRLGNDCFLYRTCRRKVDSFGLFGRNGDRALGDQFIDPHFARRASEHQNSHTHRGDQNGGGTGVPNRAFQGVDGGRGGELARFV